MSIRPWFNKLRHSILVTVFYSERTNSGVYNSMLSVSQASAKVMTPSTRFLTSFTQVSQSRSASIFRQRCLPVHHRPAWRGLFPSNIHIINNGPLSFPIFKWTPGKDLWCFHTRARQRQDNDKTNVEPVHSYNAFHTRFVGPGVKGIIGMHRFNIILSLSCHCLALVWKHHNALCSWLTRHNFRCI